MCLVMLLGDSDGSIGVDSTRNSDCLRSDSEHGEPALERYIHMVCVAVWLSNIVNEVCI